MTEPESYLLKRMTDLVGMADLGEPTDLKPFDFSWVGKPTKHMESKNLVGFPAPWGQEKAPWGQEKAPRSQEKAQGEPEKPRRGTKKPGRTCGPVPVN